MPTQIANFSHWVSGATASTTAVDTDGRQWTEQSDGSWRSGNTVQPGLPIPTRIDARGTSMNPGTGAGQPATHSEITGIRSAIAHLDAVAAAHAAHAGDEGFLGSLTRMEVGAGDQERVRAAQEQSRNAAALWAAAAASMRSNNMPVSEAYSHSPGAGNKQAQTNE